jgi:hypothetical protein
MELAVVTLQNITAPNSIDIFPTQKMKNIKEATQRAITTLMIRILDFSRKKYQDLQGLKEKRDITFQKMYK